MSKVPYLDLYFKFWGGTASAAGYKVVNKLGRESAGTKKVHSGSGAGLEPMNTGWLRLYI